MQSLINSLFEQTYRSSGNGGEESEGGESEGGESEEDSPVTTPNTEQRNKTQTPNDPERTFQLSVHVYHPFVKFKTNVRDREFSPPTSSFALVREILRGIWPNMTNMLNVSYTNFYTSDYMTAPENWSIENLELNEFYDIITTSIQSLDGTVINIPAGSFRLSYIENDGIKRIQIGPVGRALQFES